MLHHLNFWSFLYTFGSRITKCFSSLTTFKMIICCWTWGMCQKYSRYIICRKKHSWPWPRFVFLRSVKNRCLSFVPAPGCRSPRTASVYCAQKKAITMLMCRSRRVNPTRAGKRGVKGWWREPSHRGLTAKRRLGSDSYQKHKEAERYSHLQKQFRLCVAQKIRHYLFLL